SYLFLLFFFFFFFSSRRRHTRSKRDWSSDVCSSDLYPRDLGRDRRLAADRGVDCLFLPETTALYPSDPLVRVAPGPMADTLEGRSEERRVGKECRCGGGAEE